MRFFTLERDLAVFLSISFHCVCRKVKLVVRDGALNFRSTWASLMSGRYCFENQYSTTEFCIEANFASIRKYKVSPEKKPTSLSFRYLESTQTMSLLILSSSSPSQCLLLNWFRRTLSSFPVFSLLTSKPCSILMLFSRKRYVVYFGIFCYQTISIPTLKFLSSIYSSYLYSCAGSAGESMGCGHFG